MGREYRKTVENLRKLDMPDDWRLSWPDYLKMGLSEEDIPDLIHLATDMELLLQEEDEPEVWGPVHAWRALGQLKAQEAVEPLLNLFHVEESVDWIFSEIPMVISLIGPTVIPVLKKHVQRTYPVDRIIVSILECLFHIARDHPDKEKEIIDFYLSMLKSFETQTPYLNSFLIWFLIDLDARDAIPVMEQAFEAGIVDETIVGDWEEVQIDLGLLERRISPQRDYFWDRLNRLSVTENKQSTEERKKSLHRKAEKKKAKRKMAKSSRKKQKKKNGKR
ncbi:MAG: hypothetical protein EH225_04595 [Calditrichaeota bacterium]|nr:hypothetical protein [Calditrichota bacterium]RQW05453.1 MAG: hypothetical protein EH225_04595 [Calditrichota bacterium]